jgi:hypothetical protein
MLKRQAVGTELHANPPLSETETGVYRRNLKTYRLLSRLSDTLLNIYLNTSVGIATGYGLDNQGSGVESRWGLEIFFSTASRPGLQPTQPPIQ